MKPWRNAAISGVLAACLLAGCGQTAPSQPQQPDAANETTTLDWYVNFSWFNTGWGESDVSRLITEKTKVEVNFMAPMGSEREKLDALIAQGNLPDILTLGWWEPQVQQLMDEKYAYPLNQLAAQYAPDFFDVAGEGQLRWYTQEDGNIYCYPNCSISPQDHAEGVALASNQTFLVRKDIYEALGSPDMTTPEGFSNAIRLAAQKFPEIDGEPLIPFGAHEFNAYGCDSFGGMLLNFLAVPFEKDGKMYDRTSDPEYLVWLKAFRQLFQEGYLSPDLFIDKRAQMAEKIKRGQYFCMLYQYSDMADEQKYLWSNDPDKIYIAVDGPKNSRQDPHRLPGVGINGWTVTFISKNCSDPEKAIQLLTYMMTEECQKLTYLGIEGQHYTWNNGVAELTPAAAELFYKDYGAYVKQIGANNSYWMLENTAMQSHWPMGIAPELTQPEQWSKQYSYYTAPYEVSCEDAPDLAAAEEKIKKLWGDTLPQLLMAENDEAFNALFQDFLARRQALGFDAVLAEQTKQMLNNKSRLGIG